MEDSKLNLLYGQALILPRMCSSTSTSWRRRGQHDIRRPFESTAPIAGLRGSIGRILSLVPPEGARQTALAGGAWITKQSLGERLREMEELGWVTTDADPADRRARVVQRTAHGDRVLATVDDTIAASNASGRRRSAGIDTPCFDRCWQSSRTVTRREPDGTIGSMSCRRARAACRVVALRRRLARRAGAVRFADRAPP